MNYIKFSTILLIATLFFTTDANAQFGKKLKEKFSSNNKTSSSNDESTEPEIKKDERNEWAKNHAGQIVFYNKYIPLKDASADSESGVVTSAVLAANTPLYFRAYFEKDFKTTCPSCSNLDIKFTMGGESITTQQLRNEMPEYYLRMATALSFYDQKNFALSVALNSAKAKYANLYTLQEDAYRILLSRIEDKIVKGATLTLKIEITGLSNKVADSQVIASGEIPLTVTDESYNLQNLNCRCGKPGITDASIVKDVKDAFLYQFDDVEEVYEVVILDREFTINYDNSYPNKNILSKGAWANIVYKGGNGIYMMVKRYVFYRHTGSGFSNKAAIGKHSFYLPISPTCAK